MIDVQPISTEGLDVFQNIADLRKDLHTFFQDITENGAKRSHRENALPKAVCKRLAKKMNDPEIAKAVAEHGDSSWICAIDRLALQLGFVKYNTEGEYMGYTSTTESYPDNYITTDQQRYGTFIAKTLQEQEISVLGTLVKSFSYDDNEFFDAGPLSILDDFDHWGCATGILPKVNFARTRRLLLDVLSLCMPGQWLSVASLVEYVKQNEPYFLISKKLGKNGRYGNFREGKKGDWRPKGEIADTDPTAFERVEGRYVERFLEGIPLTLGYVDVAYKKNMEQEIRPSRGLLVAFRLTERGRMALSREIPNPEVTILPNHEVHVEGLFYSESVMSALRPYADVETEGLHTIFKLRQKKVTAAAAESGNDALADLRRICKNPIPANLERELVAWQGRADAFTLYIGFGLVEGDTDNRLNKVAIAPGIGIVLSAPNAYHVLEKAECVPILVEHGDGKLQVLEVPVKSRFTAKPKKKARQKRKALTLSRSVEITLRFPNASAFDAFCDALLQTGTSVQLNRKLRTAVYPEETEKTVKDAIGILEKTYKVKFC